MTSYTTARWCGATHMTSETAVQQAVRLEYARRGYKLFRNNRGAMTDGTGRVVRFGLGNDSAVVNDHIKSSDLIGWRPVMITPADVGRTIAQIVSLECKPPGWHLTPGDKRGQAQARWIELVLADGGEARFVTQI